MKTMKKYKSTASLLTVTLKRIMATYRGKTSSKQLKIWIMFKQKKISIDLPIVKVPTAIKFLKQNKVKNKMRKGRKNKNQTYKGMRKNLKKS